MGVIFLLEIQEVGILKYVTTANQVVGWFAQLSFGLGRGFRFNCNWTR